MPTPTELVERYVALWNEPDPERRRATVRALWTEDGGQILHPPKELREQAAALGFFASVLEARGHAALEQRVAIGRSDGLIIADSAGALACWGSRRPRPVCSLVVLDRGAELAFDAWWAREPLLGVDARSAHGRGWGAHQMRGGLGDSQSCVRRVSQQRAWIWTPVDSGSPAAVAAAVVAGSGWFQSRLAVIVSPSGSASIETDRSAKSSAGGSGSRHHVR
jgi:hypothetical protein